MGGEGGFGKGGFSKGKGEKGKDGKKGKGKKGKGKGKKGAEVGGGSGKSWGEWESSRGRVRLIFWRAEKK